MSYISPYKFSDKHSSLCCPTAPDCEDKKKIDSFDKAV